MLYDGIYCYKLNLPTIIVAALVFGALGWVVWHTHKHGGGCSCGGDCSHCKGCH